MGDHRRKDVVFQVTGLLLVIAVLVVSAGPLYSTAGLILTPLSIVAAVLFVIGLIISVSAQVTINKNYSWPRRQGS